MNMMFASRLSLQYFPALLLCPNCVKVPVFQCLLSVTDIAKNDYGQLPLAFISLEKAYSHGLRVIMVIS